MPFTSGCREKIDECQKLLSACEDPIARQVYLAMLDEFIEKLAADRSTVGTHPTKDGDHRSGVANAVRTRV
jgi:hypothetical protein